MRRREHRGEAAAAPVGLRGGRVRNAAGARQAVRRRGGGRVGSDARSSVGRDPPGARMGVRGAARVRLARSLRGRRCGQLQRRHHPGALGGLAAAVRRVMWRLTRPKLPAAGWWILAGTLVSTSGSAMQTLAAGKYLYDQTGSAAAFGAVMVFQQVLAVMTQFVAGPWVDRHDQRRTL